MQAISRCRALPSRLALILLLALAPAIQTSAAPQYRVLTILHTNDTHDHLLPFSFPTQPGGVTLSCLNDIGGIARRAALARRIRAEQGGNTLLLDAGDTVQGTPFSLLYQGDASFAAMSAAGYDALVPGNHEYALPLADLRRNVRNAAFSVLCANVRDRKTGKPELPAYRIFERGGVRVAVLGLTVPSGEYLAGKEGLDFDDPVAAARHWVPILRQQADLVVVLSHLGESEDENLARAVPGIDVIIGGHSHTFLAQPRFIAQPGAAGAYTVGGTVIAQAFEKGVELGRLDLYLRRDGGPFTVMSYQGELLPITNALPEDRATAHALARYARPILKTYGRRIGEATATFHDDRSKESAVLNLVCDSLREAAGTPIAIYGVGGIRGDIQQGPLRAWDLTTVLPFRNRVQILRMTGKRIKQGLERFTPGVSGMRYRCEQGHVVEASVGDKPLEDEQVYEVATIDWLVGLFFSDVAVERQTPFTSLEALTRYVEKHGKIAPVTDGRRVVK